ncbi:hypothetical protein BDA99DRAFT_528504 [Phascolomyces articulosus]|uniref:Uncharacterized protein n=1 Tax=Phascolomyces articulosus TaxID=60185 RepID=A0AAD5JY65_9FUNG|nr:hypothetical protein BDA99DRAFT_528504 [Phascolomyces articulosus]
MQLSSTLGLFLLLLSNVSAMTVYVNYCEQSIPSMIDVQPNACAQQMAFQDVCGIMTQGPTPSCDLYTDLDCQSQPVFSGHNFGGQNKGKLGSIKCQQ